MLAVGTLLATLAVAVYVFTFGPNSGFSLSPTDGAWSNFGSYIGGVLGPVFSFLAFAGVLLTVWLQAQQLDESRAQANLQEIQRVLSSLATRIDELLAQVPNEQMAECDQPIRWSCDQAWRWSLNNELAVFGDTLFKVAGVPRVGEQERRQV